MLIPLIGLPQNKTLTTLKAFPSAFGAGKDLTGGRGGTYYAVTNTNNSGAGSFRDAISSGNRIIIIQVEGLCSLTSAISGTAPDNITIWGQFAPGYGLTVSDNRITFERSNNWITRHVTFQNDEGDPDRSAVAWREMDDVGGLGHYIDHVSAHWGSDQTLDVSHRVVTNRSTVAYTLHTQAESTKNTGGIIASGGTGTDLDGNAGDFTFARNAYISLSHRTPNMAFEDFQVEHYNNYIVNFNTRLSQVAGGVTLDWFNNYVERGNAHPSSCATCVNKFEYRNVSYYDQFRVYTGFNWFQYLDETPSDNQTNLWVLRGSGHPDGAVDDPIPAYHYVSARQHDFGAPPDGIWDAVDTKTKVLDNVGHNRGINTDGTPLFFNDDVDDDFITRARNGTTRSTRLVAAQHFNTTYPGTSMYADADGDYMPDWFENQHTHLNPNDNSDRDLVHTNWDFGAYTVTNNAGYTNLEMAAAFYADDFSKIPNDVQPPVDEGIKIRKSSNRIKGTDRSLKVIIGN